MKTRKKIKELRKLLELSQYGLAVELNVSRTTIVWWEAGKRKPSINSCKKMVKLAHANGHYHVSIDWLRPD